jgi:hypothetical protein
MRHPFSRREPVIRVIRAIRVQDCLIRAIRVIRVCDSRP